MLTVEKHCSEVCCAEFPMPETGRKSKQVKNTVTQKILFAISMGKSHYFRHLKSQNLWINNKARMDKIAICLHLCVSAEYLQKI